MQTMVPLYGFGGGGGTGAALTVTAPAGCTVTVSKDGKTKTKVAGADGVAVFRGLATGQWTVNMTDGAQTAPTRTADITADYAITMSFFAATIHVTYPSGSTCTATDGVTTLTAPDTSGTWDCVVPNAGTWTICYRNMDWTSVVIESNGQEVTARAGYLIYGGDTFDLITGGWEPRATIYNSGFDASGAPYVTKNNDNIIVTEKDSSYKGGIYHTISKIDLTNVKTLHFKGVCAHNSYGGADFRVYSDIPSYITDSVAFVHITNGINQYFSLDVADLSGSYIIAVSLLTGNAGEACTVTIEEVYLECGV